MMITATRWLRTGLRPASAVLRPRGFASSPNQVIDENVLLPLFPPATREALRQGLESEGFCILRGFASNTVATAMRHEAERLYKEGYMFQSMSVDEQGKSFPKNNVFASELDGHEWDVAPTILHYTRSIMLQAPSMLNELFPELQISSRAYASKLAVSLGDGASYPKHCDTAGLPDQRKVTMVYYLNPHWEPAHGGELQVYTKDGGVVAVEPRSDTLAVFWSDQVVHDVRPCANAPTDERAQRYALTLWLVSDDPLQIVNPMHPLYKLRCEHFGS
ncbi:hypothetical protein H310_08919 [Aphanomyces invadans]|uniref:Fe2OG dioxygenase domain-containing protein n=1 Tax=Aphanomyces invadans TaxID=157072 RepID=A0A024TX27_9STRA|nr:hypothetical protein H310_08919 [Aphanomyces invadans]ETV98191.1 hypothetical protein H310_08919 [Aphanomyces invadans]|eukprot:XP_008873066.1 hypothetical protein H310_08919 [Aphanomyces invadans]